MADRIVIMNAGRIEQIGTPEEVYEHPNSEFVARFIGGSNVLKVIHAGGRHVDLGGHALEIGQGEFAGAGKSMNFCIKTHDVELLADGTSGGNTVPGTIRSQAYLGGHRDYIVDVGQEVMISAPTSLALPTSGRVAVRFKPECCRGLVR